jgi:hypothetical protein
MAISACKDSLLSAEEIVANNSIKEYQMAKNSGQPIEICVAAMSVVAAFLQAHDEINYKKWQNIKNQDCKSAGITL